jgi:hypothetical protein
MVYPDFPRGWSHAVPALTRNRSQALEITGPTQLPRSSPAHPPITPLAREGPRGGGPRRALGDGFLAAFPARVGVVWRIHAGDVMTSTSRAHAQVPRLATVIMAGYTEKP